MYTLRRILEDDAVINFGLGSSYTVIRKGSERFEEISKDYWGKIYKDVKDSKLNLRVAERDNEAFIVAEDGTNHFILPWQRNYVMTDSGKTFERL